MTVAIPGAVVDVDETTTARAEGWGAGPVGLMGVTTGRYVLPHPAITTAAAMAVAVSINNTRFPRGFMGKRLIQFFPAYFVIVNQPDGGPGRRHSPPLRTASSVLS